MQAERKFTQKQRLLPPTGDRQHDRRDQFPKYANHTSTEQAALQNFADTQGPDITETLSQWKTSMTKADFQETRTAIRLQEALLNI